MNQSKQSMQDKSAWSHPNQTQTCETIIRSLERIGHRQGYRPERIFQDWLQMVETTLNSLPICPVIAQYAYDPDQVSQMIEGALYGENLPDQTAVKRYQAEVQVYDHFAEATKTLLLTSMEGYADILGSTYMFYATMNKYHAQFFTPMNVALLMAGMTVGDGTELITTRLQEAAEKAVADNSAIEALLLSLGFTAIISEAFADPTAVNLFFDRLLPTLKPYFEPYTICDPCIGSGILLLAAASQFPDWAIHWGWVQFYGMDIDPTCVQMARINFKLYGLNGQGWNQKLLFKNSKHVLDVTEANDHQLAALPEPSASTYRAFRDAQKAGDTETVIEMTDHINEVRAWMSGRGLERAEQLSLLDQEEANS